jgi:outer membrane usher protein
MKSLHSSRKSACFMALVAGLLAGAPLAEAARGGGRAIPLKAATTEEMWLAVALNGRLTGTTALVRYDHNDHLWVTEEELRTWRLTVPDEADTSLPGLALYPLRAFEGLTFKVDEVSQTLTVDAPAHLFESVQVDANSRDRSSVSSTPPGGFFNYDIVATHSSLGLGANALLEAGAFGRFGAGVTRYVERKHSLGTESVRLDTTWTLDRPESLASLRVGDAITGASSGWGGAVRFGGVQWASNFATQPGLVTMPLPSVGGESALPSTLELYVNDALRMRQDLPGGPFTVRDVPIMSGDGQIRVVVRDLLGREQVITQSYYSSPQMLRRGLHEFSIEAGAVRENFSLASNDYGRPLIVGTERYGFTNRITGEIHAEVLEDQQTAGVSAGVLVGDTGILNFAAAGSRSETGTGQLAAFGFERTAARFSIGLNATLASDAFTRIGLMPGESVPKLNGQLFANVALGRAGSLSLMGARQQFHDGETTDLVSLRHSLNLRGFGYLSLSALRVAGARSETSFALMFGRAVGRLGSTSMSITSDEEGLAGYAQMQRGVPAGTGFGYKVRARAGDVQATEGAVSYQNGVGTYSLDAQQVDGAVQTRASMGGGLALMGAGFFPSRRIDSSFAIARVGDQANVRIYRDNQLVARTNADGYAILPGLRAYEENQISIEQSDLPLDVSVKALREKAVPAFRSGMLLTFPIERARGALLTVMLENGEPLPAGSVVTVSGQSESFPSGLRGEVYISQLADRNRLRAVWAEGTCEFDVAYTPSDDPLPLLGPYECRVASP